jgi:hypothetical protein
MKLNYQQIGMVIVSDRLNVLDRQRESATTAKVCQLGLC